jgi:tyrosine-protein phosphatase YwqE
MNSLSLLGYYGEDVKKICQQLLDLQMYEFIGTDTHRIEHIMFTKEVPLKISLTNCKQLEALIQSNRIFSTSSF